MQPIFIEKNNLSYAWAEAVRRVDASPSHEMSPLVVSITGFDENLYPQEDIKFRCSIDKWRTTQGLQPIRTIANTLFPDSYWNPNRERSLLYERYRKVWPSIRKSNGNHFGTYFQRLINFNDLNSHWQKLEGINQLEHIISIWENGNHRRSALQATIFDPFKDHTNQRQRGFPCLQQISIVPHNNQNMSLVGIYPLHYLIERAYGNYLGLAWLGRFMAINMGLQLRDITCISTTAKIDSPNRAPINDLLKIINPELSEEGTSN